MTGKDRETQPEQDAFFAWTCATNAIIRMDQVEGSSHEPTPAQVFKSYARDVYDHCNGDRARLYAAARQACLEAAERVEVPGQWRVYLRAVELCRRAAIMPESDTFSASQLAIWETVDGARVVLTGEASPGSFEWHCEGCGKSRSHAKREEAEAYGWQHSELCAA